MRIDDRITTDPCVLCDTVDRHVVEVVGRGSEPLTTVICDGCGLLSHHPLPEQSDLETFYEGRYRSAYKGVWRPKAKHSLRAQRSAALRAARLAPILRPGAMILDVGASSGEFVYMMQQLGFRASGIEPNQGYREYGIATYGIEVAARPLKTASFGRGVFDMITLNHVFEHLAEPEAVLEVLRHWLAPDGLLFIEVPNTEGVSKRRATLFHYAHVWNFTPLTLAGLLARGGFEPVEGEDLASTSLVLRPVAPRRFAVSDDTRCHSAQIRKQLAQDQSNAAYLRSGSPFRRRWSRLKRNVNEIATTMAHRSVRTMADSVLIATEIRSGPGARTAVNPARVPDRSD
jgi:SAM-dependent methyltransferase